MYLFKLKISLKIINQPVNFYLSYNTSIYKNNEVDVANKTHMFQLKQIILSNLNLHNNLEQIVFHENDVISFIKDDELIPLSFLQNQNHLKGLIVPLFLN